MVYLAHFIPIFADFGERAPKVLESTTKIVLLVYSASPAELFDTVLRGNISVACDRRSETSETSEIPARSFSTLWWLKSNRLWFRWPECNGIYGILTEFCRT